MSMTRRKPVQYKLSHVRTDLQEPDGWDFEEVHFWPYLSPNWWFVPWEMTTLLTPDTSASIFLHSNKSRKLIIQKIRDLNDAYYGSGIVVDGPSFRIIGCYKLFSSTPKSHELRTKLLSTREKMTTKPIELATLQAIPTRQRTKTQKREIKKIEESIAYYPTKMKRMNGLLLDPRPCQVAIHKRVVFEISSVMNGRELREFGKRYDGLYEGWKRAMGVDWDEVEDVPEFYRDKEYGAEE